MNSRDTNPRSSTQRAVEELRELILTGQLSAGSDHLESELAERLGMSRTPVREAARILEARGLLMLRPRKGVRVLPVSPEDMAGIYDILTELESLAAERAAEAGYGDEDLAEMSDAIADMDAAIEARDLEAWSHADDRFHSELVRLGRNPRVISICAMMIDQVRRARAITLFMRPLPVRSNEDHRAVKRAIQVGDAAEARRLHREHREGAKNMIIALLKKHRLRRL